MAQGSCCICKGTKSGSDGTSNIGGGGSGNSRTVSGDTDSTGGFGDSKNNIRPKNTIHGLDSEKKASAP